MKLNHYNRHKNKKAAGIGESEVDISWCFINDPLPLLSGLHGKFRIYPPPLPPTPQSKKSFLWRKMCFALVSADISEEKKTYAGFPLLGEEEGVGEVGRGGGHLE